MSKRTHDLMNRTFTRLTVVSKAPPGKNGVTRWNVVCICGQTRVVVGAKLLSGEHKSCGCRRLDKMREWQKACEIKIIDGKRKCTKCKEMVPVENFSKSKKTKSGLQCKCKLCARRYMWVKKFGVSWDEAAKLSEKYNKNKCDVCKLPGTMHLDHDHESGQLRGILCQRCNAALGLLKDDPVRIGNLQKYIVKHSNRKL